MCNPPLNPTRPERHYGLDFLRFISMLMIVCLHVIGNGGLLGKATPLTIKGEFVWFLEIMCYCSVNCFALISGYLGIHSKHKWENIVSLSVQALFYCILFTIICVCTNIIQHTPFDLIFFAKSLVPALFGRYWYFSAYFCLFFFMPILDRIVDMPKPILKRAAVLIVVVFCCVSQLQDKISSLSEGYSFLWLAILYIVGGYIAKHNLMNTVSSQKSFLGYIICIFITFGSKLLISSLTNAGRGSAILISYTSPTIVLASVFLLNAFVRMHIKDQFKKGILFLSSCSFGVYLIHCQPVVFDKLLANAFVGFLDQRTILLPLFIIASSILIYLVCALIEQMRKYLFKWTKIDALVNMISTSITKLFDMIEKPNDPMA